jgi:hypothetical protein
MKSQQSGFAHAVLIIGLVVALIGALGFVFWQNFIYKEPVTANNETVIVKKQVNTNEPDANTAFTDLAGWNARIPSGSQKYELTKGSNDESEYYIITTDEVNKKCGMETSPYIGTIYRYKPDTKLSLYEGRTAQDAFADTNAKVVTSKYIYILAGPQSVCSEDAQVQKILITNIATLKARFDKLEEY